MEEETLIMAALSSLPPLRLKDLTDSILPRSLHHHRRLATLLSSPALFFLTIQHLHSLSLHKKTLLIARHLLSSLHYLTRQFHPPPPQPSTAINNRDLDAGLLLLLLCETYQRDPEALGRPYTEWRLILSNFFSGKMLSLSGGVAGGSHGGAVLLPYIEMLTRCRKFVGAMGCGEKGGREKAASPAAVVSLPAVEVRGGGAECVICKEELWEGLDACELPCQHLFHWMCILPWLRKRNTCPCCRFELPSDDVYGEIERLWDVLVKASCVQRVDRELM